MPPDTDQARAPALRPAAAIAGPERAGRLSLAEERRARLLAAALQELVARGAAGVSMNGILRRAGVSRGAFLALFPNAKGCLTAALEDCLARAGGRAREACEAQERWHERVRAGLGALLSFLEQEPMAARALIVQAPTCGPRMIARRAQVMKALAATLDEGRTAAHGTRGRPESRRRGRMSEGPPELTAEGLVGAVWTVLHSRLAFDSSPRPRLSDLLDPLMAMIVLPYLGPAAARRESRVRPARS